MNLAEKAVRIISASETHSETIASPENGDFYYKEDVKQKIKDFWKDCQGLRNEDYIKEYLIKHFGKELL